MSAAQSTLKFCLRLYQRGISPLLTAVFGPAGFGCRFEPTCSQYAIDAVQEHGALVGSWYAARRLCRCHPWGGHGIDPVPTKRQQTSRGTEHRTFNFERPAPNDIRSWTFKIERSKFER